jgi:hypothetical protein
VIKVLLKVTDKGDQHRSERPVLLAVGQQLGETATLPVAENSPIRS